MHSPILKSPWGHFAVIEYLGGYAPVSDLESVWPTMVSFHAAGLSGEPGPYSTITVDGSPGIIAEGELSGGPIEFLVVDHANHTYVVMFTGSVDGFAQMLSRGFDPILASWHWN